MDGKRILLIVGGGIAAYKSLELIRLLAREGVGARAILTKAGAEFVTPLSVSALSGEKVFQELFNLTDEAEMGHIELSRSADLVVVCPATADLMAKAANGLANDLASAVVGVQIAMCVSFLSHRGLAQPTPGEKDKLTVMYNRK